MKKSTFLIPTSILVELEHDDDFDFEEIENLEDILCDLVLAERGKYVEIRYSDFGYEEAQLLLTEDI